MTTDRRPAPYPPDTRAKGWRFELDTERIQQSDTWALAPSCARPWLLMLWVTAWGQTPCGSLPADDALIVARIGISPDVWSASRAVLMRGWWLADDGRLYHDTMAERVREMMAARGREKDRKAAYRARMDAERAVLSPSVPVVSAGVPALSHGTDATSTGTGTRTGLRNTPPSEVAPSAQLALIPATPRATTLRAVPPSPPPSFDGHNADALNCKSIVAIAVGWELPGEWGMDAEALGFKAHEVMRQAEMFRQYWTAGKGSGTRRSVKGWRQSWSNWLSKAAKDQR